MIADYNLLTRLLELRRQIYSVLRENQDFYALLKVNVAHCVKKLPMSIYTVH